MAYARAFGSLLVAAGLGDMYGRKRVLITALIGFAVASAIGGAAVSFVMLVSARSSPDHDDDLRASTSCPASRQEHARGALTLAASAFTSLLVALPHAARRESPGSGEDHSPARWQSWVGSGADHSLPRTPEENSDAEGRGCLDSCGLRAGAGRLPERDVRGCGKPRGGGKAVRISSWRPLGWPAGWPGKSA
jgi:hypothetical protein